MVMPPSHPAFSLLVLNNYPGGAGQGNVCPWIKWRGLLQTATRDSLCIQEQKKVLLNFGTTGQKVIEAAGVPNGYALTRFNVVRKVLREQH